MRTVQMVDLAALAENAHPLSISIYMPSHRGGSDTRQDPIRLKNLLRQAEQQLIDHGMGEGNARRRLAPLSNLLHENEFWRHQDSGLAIFVNQGKPEIYNLPCSTEELVFVGDHFYLKPLLPVTSEDGRFLVLALSQDQVRTFECTRYSIDEIRIEGVPQHFAEYERFVEHEDSLQMYTPGFGNGGQTMVFHGHGGAADEANNKRQLEQYCHLVNQGMSRFMRDLRIPLVLAAAEPLAGIYRKINLYPGLHEEIIPGNPQRLRPDELLHMAAGVLDNYFHDCTRRASATYHQASAQGMASKDPKAIVPAAFGGQVDSLLVSLNDHLWGTFDPDTGEMVTHDQRQSGDQDLLDLAASKSMQFGGAVFGLQREEMPDGLIAAATFRYAMPPTEGTQKLP